ncbi:MAG: hypothetical protein H6Q87_1196, partial [candidate division NC10 bacterium]|nr:hypothetical protein [candidate division NC10 bacterium]
MRVPTSGLSCFGGGLRPAASFLAFRVVRKS